MTGNLLANSGVLFSLGTTSPWKSAALAIEQNGIAPSLVIGDSGTTSPFFIVNPKGRIGIATSTPGRTFSVQGAMVISGNAFIDGLLTVNGTSATSTLKGQSLFTFAPTLAHTFASWATGAASSHALDASLVINPASATADANLFGIAVNGAVRFLIDAEGDVFANSITSSGATTLSTATTSTFMVENSAQFGDAIGDRVTFNVGNIVFANTSTSTLPNLTSAFTYATSTTNTPLLTLSTKSSRYGRVGIGTSTPSALFAINALNSSNQADNLFYVGSSTQNTFVIDNHGNIGVGTSSRATSKAKFAITGNGTGTNRVLALADANNNEVLTVREDGNVGIGTTSPAGLFSVRNTGALNTFYVEDVADDASPFVIDESGNVGIGTTGPGAKLEIEQAGATAGTIRLDTSDALTAGEFVTTEFYEQGTFRGQVGYDDSADAIAIWAGSTSDLSTVAGKLVVSRSGNVGIGTTNPSSKLEVREGADTKVGGISLAASDGDIRFAYMNTSGVMNFQGGDGTTINTAILNAAGAWTNASDISYKENIADIAYGLNTIMKLKPRYYTMKGSDKKQIGFIAQELEEIIPEVVEGQDGSKGISYGNLNAAIVKAIQELNKKMETLSPAIAEGQIGYNWWINQTTGELTSNAMPLNVQGANINNVNAIVGQNWKIDGQGRITAKELCLEDICVNRDQLKDLLEKNQISGSSAQPAPPPAPELPPPPPAPEPVSEPVPPPAVEETASSTPSTTATSTEIIQF